MSLSLDHTEPRLAEGQSRTPIWVFRGVVLILFAILTAQLWRLQIIDGRAYAGRSAANSLRTAVVTPQRGVIYDRNKVLLASNAPSFVVSVTPADVPKGRTEEVFNRLANELRIPPQEIQRILEERRARRDYSPLTAIPVRSGVDREAVMRIAEQLVEMPGVHIDVQSRRQYVDGSLGSHLLGYVGPVPAEEASQYAEKGYSLDDRMGAAGVEKWYEEVLRGVPGKRLYQVEASGRDVGELGREAAQPGKNLLLTLDWELQRDVSEILQEGLQNSPSGAAIVMDPRNGEILAMASLPTFDNNVIGDPNRQDELEVILGDDKLLPMFPRAYGGTYAPGSVFKLVTGAAALQEGIATRDTVIESRGEMWVQSEEYPEIKTKFVDNGAWGRQNFLQGLANSSNIYFFWLGGGFQEGDRTIFKGLGAENLARYARAFGYEKPTGLDVPGEKGGLIPDPQWKKAQKNEHWYRGDTYNMSIGQGDVLVTPLQVANVTNAIANGGMLYQPHLGRALLDGDGHEVETIEPGARQVPIEGRHLALMREAMEFAFDGPHLRQFKIPGLRAAGKTGTAEFNGERDAEGNLPTHGWFTAFAPADHPVVSVTVFVERGKGTADASPIGARILRRYFHIPDPPPVATATPPPTPSRPTPAPPRTAQRP